MNYSFKTKLFIINEDFEIEYDSWNKIDRNGKFLLGETSFALQCSGLLNQKIYIDKSKIIKIKNKHPEMRDTRVSRRPPTKTSRVLLQRVSRP